MAPTSERLELPPITWDEVVAVVEDRRLPGWAEDFPDEGDRRAIHAAHLGGRPAGGDAGLWGHHHVIERATGLVVGGIGFRGPPVDGEAEVGYGIAPSRRGDGYATEALRTLLAAAWADPTLTAVVAGTGPGNVASQRVLDRTGFALVSQADDEWRYRVERPVP